MLKAEPEPAKEDVLEEKLGDAQSSTAIEEKEMPVLKTRGRGRKAKQDSQESCTGKPSSNVFRQNVNKRNVLFGILECSNCINASM